MFETSISYVFTDKYSPNPFHHIAPENEYAMPEGHPLFLPHLRNLPFRILVKRAFVAGVRFSSTVSELKMSRTM